MAAALTDTCGANASIYYYGSRRLSYIRDCKAFWGGCNFVAGFNWLKTGPNVRYCEGGNGYSDCIQTKNFFIRVTIRFFSQWAKNRSRQIRRARQLGSPYILSWHVVYFRSKMIVVKQTFTITKCIVLTIIY